MKLLTKLLIYFQNLGVYSGEGREQTEDLDVMSVNSSQIRHHNRYTPKPTIYDWQLEEAKWRHPSNYKKRSNK